MSVDRTRFNFNEKIRLTKKALMFEIIKKYLNQNNDIKIEELKFVFSNRSDFNIDMFVDENTYQSFNSDRRSRYFDRPFVLESGENIYLSTQWGGEVFKSLLEKIKNNLNYDIQIYSQDTVTNAPIISDQEQKFRNKYKKFVDTLPLQNSGEYAKLYTESQNKPFKVNKNSSGSIVVRAFTQQSSPMVVSANQLSKVLFNNDRYLYSSYEPVLINRIDNELMISVDEVVEDIIEPNPLPSLEINKIKNIILYGSPGVGKTYNTNKLINLIESGKSEKEIFETIKNNEYNDGIDISDIKERVKFITFHQSFGYEDFIEGFRPNEEGSIELEDGVFKTTCDEASKNMYKSFDSSKLVFDDAFDILLKDKIEDSDVVRIDLNRDNSFYEIYDYNHKSVYYTRQGRSREEKYHTLAISTLKSMYEAENIDVITGGLRTYYKPLLNKLLEIASQEKVEKVERKNYYFVIDEINRGNISKIFGELITLIEEDKRDTLEVTLPYSKKPFKIPSNLYIIGTMNSTDKSIALIDIALRRRFTFLKMEPNVELVDNVKAKNIMQQLNEKITETLGVDYVLGHSYFMKIENDDDLDFVLEYKIKPLLEEYFYGDSEGLKQILEMIDE